MKPDLASYKQTTNERCGVILDDGTIVECENIHLRPEQNFRIDPRRIVEFEDKLRATWHTHLGAAYPSGDDYICYLNWPNLLHYIIGSDGVRCYHVEKNAVKEVT